ncbi:hypothetical protein [Dipodfec virus UOA04_Rod_656]|nr:hypothetical protein [Dipodfec virus UOA04_Rod_656]
MSRSDYSDSANSVLILRTFCMFLRRHRALRAFAERYPGPLSDLMEFHPLDYILFAFSWDDTSQGADYWCRLNLKWYRFFLNRYPNY